MSAIQSASKLVVFANLLHELVREHAVTWGNKAKISNYLFVGNTDRQFLLKHWKKGGVLGAATLLGVSPNELFTAIEASGVLQLLLD